MERLSSTVLLRDRALQEDGMQEGSALDRAVAALASLPEVGAVMLGGSRASGTADAASDYDVYVYSEAPIGVSARRSVMAPCCGEMEWDNRYWETEDDGLLADGTPVEFIYRSFGWIEDVLQGVVECCQAGIGYSTCVWANLLGSRILFDRNGRAAALQARYRVPYPPALQRAIVAKNLPLIARSGAAYLHQIEQALARGDSVSVQHRVAALLASYFDILFAAHGRPHPGEKRLLAHLAALPDVPPDARSDLEALLRASVQAPAELPCIVRRLDARLRDWLAARAQL
jgi:hypothetical protein